MLLPPAVHLTGEWGHVALETGTGRGHAVPEREGPLRRSCSSEREGLPPGKLLTGEGEGQPPKIEREERRAAQMRVRR